MGIVPALTIHEDAKEDLRSLLKSDRTAAGRIVALLEQIKADPKLIDALTIDGFGSRPGDLFDVRKFQAVWRIGYDLWRLKTWDLKHRTLPYRILYAYEAGTCRYHVLAVVHRDFDYDRNHAVTRRVLHAYGELGLPVHRG